MEAEPLWKKVSFRIFVVIIILAVIAVMIMQTLTREQEKALHPSSQRVQQALEDEKIAPYYEDLIPEETSPNEIGNGRNTELQININSYSQETSLPTVPTDVNVYTLKSEFTQHETRQLAQKLLGAELQSEFNNDTSVQSFTSQFGTLSMNTRTGAFSFDSMFTQLPFEVSEEQDVRPQLAQFLQSNLGVIDETVVPTAYYRRNTAPGITFYEFHRDWDQAGLPIINPVGAVNLSNSSEIENSSLTEFPDGSLRDDTIIFASDAPGFARNTDFNTMTVAVTDDGFLVSIDSNIRPIEETTSVSSAGLSLLSPQAVVRELENDGAYFGIAVPSGQGSIDPRKLYVDGVLSGQNATITDISLAYVEKPGGIRQKYLSPTYIVRGTVETDTGIQTKFAQTVPALENERFNASASVSKILKGYLYNVLSQDALAQSDSNVRCETEIHFPCGEDQVDCVFKTDKCQKVTPTPTPDVPVITQKPPLTPIVTSEPRITPDSPSITSSYPTHTPIPDDGDPAHDPCVLYDKDLNIIEFANEFKFNQAEPIQSGTIQVRNIYVLAGIGVIAFFPENLPDGPLAVKVSDAPTPEPGTTDWRNTIPYGTSYISLQRQVEKEIAIRAAIRVKEDPSLYRKITHPRYQTTEIVDMNHIFPEVPYDMLDNRITNISPSAWILTQAVEGYNGQSLDKLVAETQILTPVPTRLLIGARRVTHTPTGIQGDAGKFILDKRCRYMSPISPLVYFYPRETTRVNFAFDHRKTTYTAPAIGSDISFTANSQGNIILTNGENHKNLYYEYSNVLFDIPEDGWIIAKAHILPFITGELAPALGLTSQETEDLVQDVLASSQNTSAPYAFIGLIQQTSVDEELPFSITPQPDTIERVHLYIDYGARMTDVNAPHIERIDRSGFTVVELGTYVR